jgi:hypothetical protein
MHQHMHLPCVSNILHTRGVSAGKIGEANIQSRNTKILARGDCQVVTNDPTGFGVGVLELGDLIAVGF